MQNDSVSQMCFDVSILRGMGEEQVTEEMRGSRELLYLDWKYRFQISEVFHTFQRDFLALLSGLDVLSLGNVKLRSFWLK